MGRSLGLAVLLLAAGLAGIPCRSAIAGEEQQAGAAIAAEADPSRPVTNLRDALELAYWSNPALLAERARLRSADFRLPQARAAFGPKLGYEGIYGYQRDSYEIAPGITSRPQGWASTATAVLSQPIYTGGRNAAAERSVLAEIDFRREALRQVEQQVLFEAIRAYAAVIRDRGEVGIATENLALLERELRDSTERFRFREVTSTDLQQVATRVEFGRAQLAVAKRAAASSEAEFVRTVGAPAGELIPPNPLQVPARSLEDAYAFADKNNPVLIAAYARERISRGQRDAARADLLPRVDLRARAEYGTVTPYTDDVRQTTLRGEVVVSGPIFESGARRARIGEASAANDIDWRLIDQAQRDNRSELALAWNEWLAANASAANFAQAVDFARAAYDGAVLQERAGFRTTLDVLDLARDLLTAQTSRNAALANAYVAQARILSAMGTLDQAYLLPEAARYDPDAHFKRVKNDGDIPGITPLLRALDGVTLGGKGDRPLRDRAAGVRAQSADLPLPVPLPEKP